MDGGISIALTSAIQHRGGEHIFLRQVKIKSTSNVVVEAGQTSGIVLLEEESGIRCINFLVQRSLVWLFAVSNPIIDKEIYLFVAVIKICGSTQVGGCAGRYFYRTIEALPAFFL